MKPRRIPRAALLAFLAVPSLALAALKDVGPANSVTGFPEWYRDTAGAALSLCTEQRPSPNASSGGAPMCFPIVPNPDGYAGNLGDENFYFNASAAITGASGFDLLWEGALEATYTNGTPIRGEEITFARIRIRMAAPVDGTYTVTHPYGVEVFPNVQAGPRSVFSTVDIGIAPGVFTGALDGTVGPFLEWATDPTLPAAPFGIDPASGLPYQLQIANIDGSSVQFLGDPNLAHAVRGSPFGTNFVRVEGPPGSNLDGAGHDFIETDLFAVLGQRFTAPIPSPLHVLRASYGVDAGLTLVSVVAQSAPGSQLVATGSSFPTHELVVDPVTGDAYGSVEFVSAGGLAPDLTVTNLTDDPHSSVVAPLTDVVLSGPAVFLPDPSGATGGSLSIVAESSVHTDPAPFLAIVEFPDAVRIVDGAAPWSQRFDVVLPAGTVPPPSITALSSAGGRHSEPVLTGMTGTLAPPSLVAAAQSLTTPEGQAVSFLASDPVLATAMVLNPPANGTAVAHPDGTITYTPKNLYSGDDSFTYVIYVVDGATSKRVYSNAAAVAVTVTAVNQPPTAVADSATAPPGSAVVIDVAANDTDVDGTVQPTSVAIATSPTSGTALVSANGTVTYAPAAGFAGTVSFTYTIADDLGTRSAPGTVTVTVLAQSEVLQITRAEWVASKGRWRVTGSSSVFGPGIVNTVTVRVGSGSTLGDVIGTAPVDALGAWSLDTTSSTVVPDATNRISAFSTGGGSTTATVTRK